MFWRFIYLALSFLIVWPALGAPASNAAVAISGEIKAPYAADINELKKFAVHEAGDLPIVCRSGQVKDRFKTSKGVLLRDLLNKAQPHLPGHFDANHAYVVVSATDGYKVMFSWNELYNTAIGDEVVLVYERDGKSVSAEEGPFVLVSGKDRVTGPRHVRNVKNIELRILK